MSDNGGAVSDDDVAPGGWKKWQQVIAAAGASLGGLVTIAVNLQNLIAQRWVAFAAVMLIACAAGGWFYFKSLKAEPKHVKHWRICVTATLAIVLIPAAIMSVTAAGLFYAAKIGPRINENGPIIAIARFQGPTLDPPYKDCRPSEMLRDTLAAVAHRYGHLTVFELPYVVKNDDPSAATWAAGHGVLEGADAIVYGQYSFVDDELSENKPNRLRISPETAQVPIPPLGPKTAPLTQWEFPDRIVRIDDLCTGHSQRFLRDGKRLFLAIVGLQAFAAQEYVSAERALSDAEQPRDDDEALFANPLEGRLKNKLTVHDDDSRCDRLPASASQCSGVLAFYLAALERQLGHYEIAEREYTFAAEKLINRPAPYVDLAELYVQENQGDKGLQALKSAESADPTSIIAAATRAQYEYQYGTGDESKDDAKIEFERAKEIANARPWYDRPNPYEQIVLCRATYYVLDSLSEALKCRQKVPATGYANTADAEVEYGRWLIATKRREYMAEGIEELRRATATHPNHIVANYTLARALVDSGTPNDPDVQKHYLLAVNARGFTDDEFTDQGNAAAELHDFTGALDFYKKALNVNQNFAYAYENLGRLRQSRGDDKLASADFLRAKKLHPNDPSLQGAVTISEHANHAQGAP